MRRHRHDPWRFRNLELNAVGWAALLSPSAVLAAGIAGAVGAPVVLVVVAAVIGGSLAWGVALLLEHRWHDHMPMPLPVVDGDAALAVLLTAGIKATLTEVVDREGQAWSVVTVRHRDVRRARMLVPWPPGRRSGRRYQRAQRAAWEARPIRPR